MLGVPCAHAAVAPARPGPATRGVRLSFLVQRKSPKKHAAIRERRCAPVPCASANQGTARRASRQQSALQDRAASSPLTPAVLGSLQGGPNSRERTHDPGGAKPCLAASAFALLFLALRLRPEPSVGSAHIGRARRKPSRACGRQDRPRHGCRGRAYRDVLAACPARTHPQAHADTRKAPLYAANTNPTKPGRSRVFA